LQISYKQHRVCELYKHKHAVDLQIITFTVSERQQDNRVFS
jgi:hypothetical protein